MSLTNVARINYLRIVNNVVAVTIITESYGCAAWMSDEFLLGSGIGAMRHAPDPAERSCVFNY